MGSAPTLRNIEKILKKNLLNTVTFTYRWVGVIEILRLFPRQTEL